MAIITISRGSHSMGQAVAEHVAERLGYACLSRDVLLEASEQFNVPELKLQQAITDAPSILERLTHGRQRYVAYLQSALTRRLRDDDVVYHGLAGHLLLKPVTHVLKVRIIATLELRAAVVARRETIGPQAAAAWIAKVDRERQRWTRSLYGVDPEDPHLYDLMVNIPAYSVEDAAELVCRSVEMEQFATTDESRQEMRDLALACEIKAALVEDHPDAMVTSRYGNVVVYAAGDRAARRVKESTDHRLSDVEGINNIEIHSDSPPPEAAV